MVGIIGKGCAGETHYVFEIKPLLTGLLPLIDDNRAVDKVDCYRGHIVNAAQIRHQDIVDKDPDVVVPGELIRNGDFLLFIYIPAILLDKPGGHVHPEVVVDGGSNGGSRIHQDIWLAFMLFFFGVRRRLIKGEELPHRGGAAGNHARMVIEGEGVILFIEYSVILLAIIIVVAVFVHLEKPLDVGEARFSFTFLLGVK